MSSRKSLFTVGLSLAVLAMVAMVGCGDDNSTASNTQLTGAAYTQSSTHVNALVDSSISVIGKSLATVVIGTTDRDFDQVPGLFYGSGGEANADGDWLVVTNTTLSTGVTDYYLDSIQYRLNQQVVDESRSANAMLVRHLWRRTSEDTTLAYGDYEIRGDLTINALDTDNATVGGTVELDFDSKITVNQQPIWEEISVVSSYSDFTIGTGYDNWVNGCPASGTVTADVRYIRTVGTTAPDTTDFEYTVTFNNGTASTQAVSGNQTGTYSTDYCQLIGN